MMSQVEIKKLIREMKSVYDGDPWYGDPVKKVLRDITIDQAFDRPFADAHCIAELVSHMITWRELLNHRLHGDDAFSVRQEESFDWKRIDADPKTAWNSLLNVLDKSQAQMVAQLERSDDALLKQKVAKRKYAYRYLINGIIEHDIYHLGQIVLLKKGIELGI